MWAQAAENALENGLAPFFGGEPSLVESRLYARKMHAKKVTSGTVTFDFVEPLSRIELLTSSLPRMHSTD